MEQQSQSAPTTRIVEPSMRVNALFQIALGLSMDRSARTRSMGDLRFTLGSVRDGAYQQTLSLANGDYDLAFAVAKGEMDVAAINPSCFLSMAYRGKGLYPEALPVRVIATMPSLDVMLFAVSKKTGITSLADIAEKRYPLKVSVRRAPIHGTRFVVDQVFDAHGFSIKDLESWGGSVHYGESPTDPGRLAGVRDGTIDAVFDEGVRGWAPLALEHGMAFLDLDPVSRARLDQVGWAAVLVRSALPEYTGDAMAPSFSGWPIFTRASLDDDLAYNMCLALEGGRERVVWDAEEPVTMADICRGTEAAPRDVPLHPGAERFYKERGYL